MGDTFCQKYRGPQFNPSSALLRAILEIGSNTSHEPLANPVRSQGAMEDYTGVGLRLQRCVGAERESGYDSFREKLVHHVHFMRTNGWLQHNH